jgi:hypothetical protein
VFLGLLIGVAAGLLVAATGVVGLIARVKVPYEPPRRQLYASIFRLAAGVMVVFVTVLSRW